MLGEADGRVNLGEIAPLPNVERRIDGRSNRWAEESAERIASGADLRQAARQASADWLATLAPWDLYCTLTYDQRRWYSVESPPKPHVATRHFNTFIRRAGRDTSRPILAVGALEETRAGWPHWHAMLATGGLDERLFSLVSSDWFKAHGYAKFYRIRPNAGLPIAQYITKYLTKDDATVEFVQSDGAKWTGTQTTLRLRNHSSGPR